MGLIFQNKGEFLVNKRVKHRIMLTKTSQTRIFVHCKQLILTDYNNSADVRKILYKRDFFFEICVITRRRMVCITRKRMSHNEVSISGLDKNSSIGRIYQNKGEFLVNKRVKHRIMLTKTSYTRIFVHCKQFILPDYNNTA